MSFLKNLNLFLVLLELFLLLANLQLFFEILVSDFAFGVEIPLFVLFFLFLLVIGFDFLFLKLQFLFSILRYFEAVLLSLVVNATLILRRAINGFFLNHRFWIRLRYLSGLGADQTALMVVADSLRSYADSWRVISMEIYYVWIIPFWRFNSIIGHTRFASISIGYLGTSATTHSFSQKVSF